MRWFSKRPKRLVPDEVLRRLNSFGSARWEAVKSGRPVNDPRFAWGDFFGKVFHAYQLSSTRTVAELHDGAGDDPLARFGAYALIAEITSGCEEPLYLELMDGALQMMYDAGLSSGCMTGYEAQRWIVTHGDLRTSFDRLVEVAPSPPGTTVLDLVPGQSVKVAVLGPDDLANQFWIECTEASKYRAFSMRRKDSDATTLSRCEEPLIGESDSGEGILIALGRYLREPTYWALKELDPYFIERRRGTRT